MTKIQYLIHTCCMHQTLPHDHIKTANDNPASFDYPAYWWTSPTDLAPVIFIHFNSSSLLCVHTEAQDSTDTHYDTFCETIRHAVTVHWNATHHVRVMALPQTLMHSRVFLHKSLFIHDMAYCTATSYLFFSVTYGCNLQKCFVSRHVVWKQQQLFGYVFSPHIQTINVCLSVTKSPTMWWHQTSAGRDDSSKIKMGTVQCALTLEH